MRKRIGIIIGFVIAMVLLCAVKLFDLQVVKGSTYENQANQRLVRAYSVAAPRGEILDCNDKALVKNRMGYSIQIQKIDITDDELNRVLYDTAYIVASYGGEIESTFPIVMNEKTGEMEYDFSIESNGGTRKVEGVKLLPTAKRKTEDDSSDGDETKSSEDNSTDNDDEEKKEQEALEKWQKNNKLTELSTHKQIIEFYRKKYGVSSEFDDKKALTVVAIRYAMDKGDFSAKNPYTLARDVDEMVLQQIKEQFMDYPGVEVVIEPVREFTDGTMAAHIIGRTGRIYAEEYAEMKDKGYGINDTIGKDGLEKVLEPYLKGEDGYKSVEMNRGGGFTQILQSRDPKPGNFARLTIDSDLQGVLEETLRENIIEAVGSGGAGAAIAVDPKTFGVLAMASYPAYDLNKFNESYDKLLKSKSTPLLNRVLSGTYSPGSTFKPLVAIAALESGTITPDTYITDKGKYTYYDSYQPNCLIYSSSGTTHGTINVSQALGVSCNYFFFDVGRRMGIETIDEFAASFGLGENTGIELPESTGILAGPKYREKIGGIWQPGDVLQMSIGQSDNMFTPAQLAAYVSTILNKGRRYALHIVNEVVDYDTGEIVYRKEPELLSEKPISDSTYNAVKDGMRRVVTSGTASVAFATSKYKAAGKTGTAEVPDGADNVLFVGFAPYDDPEIVIAVIIEHGASSRYPAMVARKVFDAYMDIRDGKFGKTQDDDKEESGEDPKPVQQIRPADSTEGASGTTPGSSNGEKPQGSVSGGSSAAEGAGTL